MTNDTGDARQSFVVCRADPAAAVEVAALRRRFIESQADYGYPSPQRATHWDLEASTAQLLKSRHHIVLTARDPAAKTNPAIGYALGVRKLVPNVIAGRIGVIDEVYVATEARRRGLGENLYIRLRAELAAIGVDRFELTVLIANERAREFWLGRGLKPHSVLLYDAVYPSDTQPQNSPE